MGTTAQKLTYLNETKLQLKNMINYGLDSENKITNETTFREYVTSLFDAFIESLRNPDTLFTNLPKITDTGTSITLNDTANAPMVINPKASELEQATTTGKNLWINEIQSETKNGITATRNEDGSLTFNGTATAYAIFYFTNSASTGKYIEQGVTYTMSGIGNIDNKQYQTCIIGNIGNNTSYDTRTFSPSSTREITSSNSYIAFTLDTVLNNYTIKPMLELGDTATDYEPYTGEIASPNPSYPQTIHTISGNNTLTIANDDNAQTQSYLITLGDLEVCKIGNYEDEFYLATASDTGLTAGKWYLKKNIGKVVLNGSENWQKVNLAFQTPATSTPNKGNVSLNSYSNYYIHKYYSASITSLIQNGEFGWNSSKILTIRNDECSTNADLTAWLSTHNTEVYYVLETPTYILLNDTLQTQLNNLQKALAYQNQTNISQVNNDLPFTINASAIQNLNN